MFFDRPDSGEVAVLVHCQMHGALAPGEAEEFVELALSAGVDVAELFRCSLREPQPRTFMGAGNVEQLAALVADQKADIVLFNHILSPSQERNLEKALRCRVLDRTGLILDIFAQRARSHAGKLQVERAQLEHIATRLVRGWTHLERQKGGIGLRGPGETQLETDRRLLRERIQWINSRLDKVHRQRQQGRRSRQRAEVPTVALVGYTNAGKSTLFNRLTDAEVYAADQLFATLDPTLRGIAVPHFGKAVLADTVGFIRHLPHKLVDAFRATLEEAAEADLLLHVVDASAEDVEANIAAVNTVLQEIGAGDIPILTVMNKIDALTATAAHTEDDGNGMPRRVWVSARTGAGTSELMEAIARCLGGELWHGTLPLAPHLGRLRAQLYERGVVLSEAVDADGVSQLEVRCPFNDLQRLLHSEPGAEVNLTNLH